MAKKSETVAADSRATAVAGTKTPASVKEEKKEYEMPSADDCPIFLRSEYLFGILRHLLLRFYLFESGMHERPTIINCIFFLVRTSTCTILPLSVHRRICTGFFVLLPHNYNF